MPFGWWGVRAGFQSTLSVRRATCYFTGQTPQTRFQSTLSVRRATHDTLPATGMSMISIHALREESDYQAVAVMCVSGSFQSTLSVRRATYHFSRYQRLQCISIHALREESDVESISCRMSEVIFQSTLSVRRATSCWKLCHTSSYFNPRSP